MKTIFLIRKNLLVFKILLNSDAGSQDGGEFGIIHNIAAGVVGEVFFYNFFSNPANAGGNAGKSCGGHDCFHKLVVRHADIIEKLFFQLRKIFSEQFLLLIDQFLLHVERFLLLIEQFLLLINCKVGNAKK